MADDTGYPLGCRLTGIAIEAVEPAVSSALDSVAEMLEGRVFEDRGVGADELTTGTGFHAFGP